MNASIFLNIEFIFAGLDDGNGKLCTNNLLTPQYCSVTLVKPSRKVIRRIT